MRQKLRGFAAAFFLTLLFVGGIAGMAREGETLRLSLSGKEFSFRITPLEQLRHLVEQYPTVFIPRSVRFTVGVLALAKPRIP